MVAADGRTELDRFRKPNSVRARLVAGTYLSGAAPGAAFPAMSIGTPGAKLETSRASSAILTLWFEPTL